MENYILGILTTSGVYALLALGLNMTWGVTGIANFGLAGFFAVGAYAAAIGSTVLGLPIWACAILAIIVGGLFGLLVSVSTIRLRGDYLAIVTLGFTEVVRLVASNETWLTKGTDGISGIPGPFRGQVTPTEYNMISLGIVTIVVIAALIFCVRLVQSPYGRVLRAIRDDEDVAMAAGKNATMFKLQAFVIGAALMGLGGAVYAHYLSYISPDLFRPLISIYIFLALTIGGSGNNFGAVLGSILLLVLLEGSRFVMEWVPNLTGVQSAAMREAIIGLTLILVTRFAAQGLLRERNKQY
ncbi:branched-chain amino acid ABC transporter permease [Devosia faecipullorum]|uniref:branched-chain amino acid ABC transporter permease n=1 Tax=Devosia faecipullorum TaxID=2755039 RepID=UPI00187B5B0C|nr:branched-chain amino acid ABC transporter permease [Devosia faecipullorum]MBE7733329.1 branched-chain amino acid ABC transporter permease [Devosia faecipullorum]